MPSRVETILTKNANRGSGGTRISREKSDASKKAILAAVPRSKDGAAFKDRPKAVGEKVPNSVRPARGSASWYTPGVRLDLEAPGLIERVPGKSPQRLRRLDYPLVAVRRRAVCWPIRAPETSMKTDQRSSGLRGTMRRENRHEFIASNKGSVPTCAFAIEPSELSRHGFFDHSLC